MTQYDMSRVGHVLEEIRAERWRQERKWGQQNHPDGTSPGLLLLTMPVWHQGDILAEDVEGWARRRCQKMHDDGLGTYEQILTEEWAEAIAEADPVKLREELIQVAAVSVAWIEAIDRRL